MKICLLVVLIVVLVLAKLFFKYRTICKLRKQQMLDDIKSLLDGTYEPREVDPIEEKCRLMREEAKDLYRKDKYKEAIAIYDELLKIEPNCALYLDEQADSFEHMHRYEDCIKNYKKALRHTDKRECYSAYSYYSHELSKVYYKAGKIKEAVKAATIAIKSNPGGEIHVDYIEPFCIDMTLEYRKYFAYEDRAKLYLKIGEYKKALKDINEALIDFNGESNIILKIKILIALKNYQEAEKYCQDSELNNFEKMVCGGFIQKGKGNLQNAISLLKQSLNLPDNGSAWISKKEVYQELADMYEQLGQVDNALDYHFKYVDYCKKYKLVSEFYFRNGDYSNAIVGYTEHLKEDKYDDEALFSRAQAYKNIDDVSNAIKDVRAAIKLKPENKEYKEFLQLLKQI